MTQVIRPRRTMNDHLLSAAKHYTDIGIEEEILLGNEVHQGYFAEVELFGQAHFDSGDGLIQAAIVKTEGLPGVGGRFVFQMPPAYRKAGCTGDLVIGKSVFRQLIEGFAGSLARHPVLDVEVIGLEQAQGKTGRIQAGYRNAVLIAFATDKVLLADCHFELVKVIQLEGNDG